MYIWNKNLPWIGTFLERQKEDGGLALLNYMYYYRAANIHKLVFWVQEEVDKDPPSWENMEQTLLQPGITELSDQRPIPLSKRLFTNSPVACWGQFRIHFSCKQLFLKAAILGNSLFPASLIGFPTVG